jgi:monoamine oxidase
MSTSPLTRRRFLKGAAALAGSSLIRPPGRAQAFAPDDEIQSVDVVIVGGGVAGAYCAWRLSQPDAAASALLRASGVVGQPTVALLEASDRIGGRLWSFVPPRMPRLRAELGGMRIPTDQTLVVTLLNQLGIETIPFPMGDDHNLRYLRGRRFTVADLGNPNVVPYDLPPELRGKEPDDIVIEVIERYIPNAGRLSEAEWTDVRRSATFEGTPLHELSFRYLMQRALPDEAFQFVRDDSPVDDFTLNGSAADLMYDWAAGFALTIPVRTPLLGMQEIPRTLVKRAEEGGAAVLRQHRLRRLVPCPDAEATAPGLLLDVERIERGDTVQIAARHVVLAMPPRAISLLASDSLPVTAPSFPALRDALIPIAAGKGFLGYERPWWRDLGITSGRTVSDLPLKLTYYMATEGERPGANPSDTTSLLMPTYAEDLELEFWQSFRRQSPDSPGGAPFQRPDVGPVPEELALSERAVEEMQRQLRLVHGPDVDIGEPFCAFMSDWSRDPYGAGSHIWAVGASAWDVVPLARQPLPGVNLSICGEAWSTRQGWSLGALMTAERTVQERFGLAWPAWLPTEVDLGP